jgi:hypothetical protein
MPYKKKADKNANELARYHSNKETMRRYQNEWRAKNKARINAQNKKANDDLKLEVLSHYSPDGILRCSFCEVTDIDILTLDHVNDDGAQDKHASGKRRGGIMLYQHVRALGFPEGYQTLCANHNLKKEILRRRAACYSESSNIS